ncbi:methionine/alanine import family NSS transporter small subunit [Actinomyces oricola]|uniref:methionine/alanine import family NSS transporter small subunit n=1 Tax=Actinomyces oricola TaxID=206043 RepID=UPI000FFF5FA4|nr:methionine/alanine import family NSS transporter small subunit [Actinomyces oricola]
MTGAAVLIMLTAIVVIWGGLAVSVSALVVRGRREDLEARRAALAAAREHMRQQPEA